MYTQKEGPSGSETHFEGPSIPSFQAEKGPISLTFQYTHPGRFANKSIPGARAPRALTGTGDTEAGGGGDVGPGQSG